MSSGPRPTGGAIEPGNCPGAGSDALPFSWNATAILRCLQSGVGGHKMQLERLGALVGAAARQLGAARGR